MNNDTQFNITAYLAQPTPWQNEPAAIRGIIITLTSIAVICVLSRLYIRLAVLRMPGWDDMFVGLYLVTTLTSAITISIAPSFGLGQHLITFTPQELRMFLILFYTSNASYVSSTTFIKLSLLFQYLRIFEEGQSRLLRRACQGLIAVVALWGAAFSFLAWVPCLPVHQYWDMAPGGGTCYGFGVSTDRTAFIAHTSINMVLDICVLALPVPLSLDSAAPRRTRAGMLVLLLLGCLVNVFAAWRLVLLVESSGSAIETLFDSTYYASDTVLLASLEVNLASVCASVPIFWPVLRQQVFRILVTKEVEITRGERHDEDKLGDSASSSRRGSFTYNNSSSGSNNDSSNNNNNNNHYGDAFIRDQVDPLRPGTAAGVETLVRSDAGKKKRGWK